MKSPIMSRVDTIFIHVTNLKESVKWYSTLLGIEFNEDNPCEGPIHTFPMGENRPGLTLDNHCFDEEEYKFNPSNQPLFNLSTEDIDEAYEFVKRMGAEFVTEIARYPDLSDFSFKDPDGNILMICSCITEN
ncbi:VOC family protein [Paenibacillus guangzhouensis]|uniref:VOC family protein n=1 Tax=Paenibacillus guangzhouensis TaxID=1473112 RepID=UPI001266B0A5|nr:VOC family protein [Paenibacillus guangzhouensis]